MANVLKMTMVEAIHSMRSAGRSCGEIARRLGIHRETVSRYGQQGPEPISKPASASILPAGNPVRRMESPPGFEAQVDFGTGAPVIGPDGRRRTTHVLRVVLLHSRRGSSEAVFTQSTDDFTRCLENAFEHFGGVPHTIVIDNPKAGVLQADWFDPELTPKLDDVCRHHGTGVLPTKPGTPRHKGKVERGVASVQDNALKGRMFKSPDEQNEHLHEWERGTADRRIHGTTRQQVLAHFNDEETPGPPPAPCNPLRELP
jgi:transposase